MTELTFLQAILIGLLQGVSELFPVSSLGHSILVPALIGGSWYHLVTESATKSSNGSSYLAFIVALHVATAIALIIFYWRTWVKLIKAFFSSLANRQIRTPDEKLIWLLIIGTIPVGLTGLLFEHAFRVLFAKPLAAAIFLTINGLILFGAEFLRKRAVKRPKRNMESLGYGEAGVVGGFQILALFAGISRSGITMVGGLLRGLDHENAANFAFLLATPVIFGAGLLKLPALFGPAGNGIHAQVLVGALVAGVAAYVSVRFLTKYFETRTLTPFAVYCVLAGLICIIRFA
jgi:undecaprenyl-diphosphatase